MESNVYMKQNAFVQCNLEIGNTLESGFANFWSNVLMNQTLYVRSNATFSNSLDVFGPARFIDTVRIASLAVLSQYDIM